MGNENNQIQKVAAVVVFKELHTGKHDVYDVLSRFINEIIIEKGLSTFALEDMIRILYQEFGFDNIPRNVVKTAVVRLESIKRENEKYSVIKREKAENVHKLIDDLEKKREENDEIINDLCNYISEKKNIEISIGEKEKITKSFCSYLFDDSNSEDEYSHDIAAYIIALKNENLQNRISNITQGIYQYSALTYNEDLSKIDRLKNELVLVFDTDILLSLGGFHGIIFKQYIEELLKLISDINVKCGKKYIKVQYLDYSWNEVLDNFKSANYYLDGMNDYVREAAKNIADGCKSKEDITLRQSNFEAVLKNKGITKLPFDSYSEQYVEYNLEGDVRLFSSLKGQVTNEEFDKASRRASDINKLRHGVVCKSFEDTRYIFITDNRKVGYIASKMSADKKTYFYVMDCCKITNVLWQKMNRGLSSQCLPASMNIITRSQVVLASCISRKINHEFSEMKQMVDNGELEEEALAAAIYRFRQVEGRPEDMTEENLDDRLNYIESQVKNYGEELSLYKRQSEEKDKELEEQKKQHENYVSNIKKRDDLKVKLEKKEKENNRLKSVKEKIDSKLRRKKIRLIIGELFIAAVLFIALPLYFRDKEVIDIVSKLSPFLSLFGLALTGLLFKNKTIDNLNNKILKKYEEKQKKREDYSEEVHNSVKEKVIELGRQLESVERDLDAG